jgi:hypothetical protein
MDRLWRKDNSVERYCGFAYSSGLRFVRAAPIGKFLKSALQQRHKVYARDENGNEKGRVPRVVRLGSALSAALAGSAGGRSKRGGMSHPVPLIAPQSPDGEAS